MVTGKYFRSFTILTIFSALLLFSSCSDSNLGPAVTNSEISYMSNTEGSLAGDLQIDSVKMLISGVQFGPNDTMLAFTNFRVGTFPLYLNMTGDVKLLSDAYVPIGTYKRTRFDVHQLLATESAPDPDFIDANGRYSVIVIGSYNGTAFTFKSQLNAVETLVFPASMTILADAVTNATIRVSPYKWFVSGGAYIDPTVPANTTLIEANIASNTGESFRVFVDTNKDGNPD